MSGAKSKPSRWYYVLAILIPIFACGLTSFFVYRRIPKLPGALESISIDNLTRVIVPGSAEINFPKEGAYAVYYEYRSVINGVHYVREKYPPRINCRLTSKVTGQNVELASPQAEGDMYSTQNRERVGVLMKTISINQPGVHIFSCRYADGRADPQVVLAVGPNFIWEFFNIAAKPFAAAVCGWFAFLGAFAISVVILVVVALKRYQSNKTLHDRSIT